MHTKYAFYDIFRAMDSPKDTTTSQDNLKERTAAGLFWSLFGNGAQQVVVMIIGIILTRLLDPADYGLVGMLTVFSILASSSSIASPEALPLAP